MTEPRQFTPLETDAMKAVEYFARYRGGADWLINSFGIGKRTAMRLVAKQQPPPAGLAEEIADFATEQAIEWDRQRAIHPLGWHEYIKVLRDFTRQRRTPKGASNG